MNTRPKPFVFVLMPFDESFRDTYEVGIKAACEASGAYCERVDEQIFQESILERIFNQIAKADLIISDMTGRNPNVFYETGYAHALGKRVILLTSRSEDIPFDLKHYAHIVYEDSLATLKESLQKHIIAYLKHPEIPTIDLLEVLHFYFNRQRITEGSSISLMNFDSSNLIVHNSSKRTVDASSVEVSMIFPKFILDYFPGTINIVPIPNDLVKYGRSRVGIIHSDVWVALGELFPKSPPRQLEDIKDGIPFALQVSTMMGSRKINFKLVYT